MISSRVASTMTTEGKGADTFVLSTGKDTIRIFNNDGDDLFDFKVAGRHQRGNNDQRSSKDNIHTKLFTSQSDVLEALTSDLA